MDRTLKLVGRSSNEIYVLRYPLALLGFLDYDLSYFATKAVEICSESQKTGEPDFDRFSELRRELQISHCYIEHHIRTIYEKIPIDCYIDFLCRRDSVGTGTLWNRYSSCRTPFEKMIFQRLCEFRYNRAINEWLNILRVREYAVSKIDFVFPSDVKSASEAAARRNYFDLIFSVTASEMGCRIDELGQTKVFSVGRLPNSPFMFPSISKDIIRNVLADFDYSDDYSDIKDYSGISDEIAMDAFSRMKSGIAAELTSYNIFRSNMEKYGKIYMPCSLKAVIDLEIDAVIESGGYLAICKKCGRRYYRDKDYDEDYCSYLHNGKSCLDIYNEENPPKRMTEELEEKSHKVTNEVYSRVGTAMSTKEYENWYSYMTAMKDKVQTGEISPEEFDDFLEYSLKVDISRSKPIVEVPKPASDGGRVVKPFIPERIDRSSLKPKVSEEESEEPELPDFADIGSKTHQDGFFVSPTVARRSSEKRISHIIRAGEVRGEESYDSRPNPADFRPFGEQPKTKPYAKANAETASVRKAAEPSKNERRYSGEEFYNDEIPRDIQNNQNNQENRRKTDKSFENQLLAELEALRGKSDQKPTGEFRALISASDSNEESGVVPSDFTNDENVSPAASTAPALTEEAPAPKSEKFGYSEISEKSENPEKPENPKSPSAPRAKVIRKNAAAISAYGKMSGTPVISAPPEMNVVSRADAEESIPAAGEITADTEPFKDIGSIFDVLENSSGSSNSSNSRDFSDSYDKPKRRRAKAAEFEEDEPAPEWSEDSRPRTAERQNAPHAAQSEDRDVYREDSRRDSQSELDMLKAKKQHPKSNKTKRLVDAIMREPDNNPNVRKK